MNKVVWKTFAWVDINHMMILSGVIGYTMVHNLFSLMLVLGGILKKRSLSIPWMVSKMFILMVVNFTCWTFMSFFVDLLVAIVFPVMAGLVLGFWIYLWRRVHSVFVQMGKRNAGIIIVKQQPSQRKSLGGDEFFDKNKVAWRPHRHLILNAENDMLY